VKSAGRQVQPGDLLFYPGFYPGSDGTTNAHPVPGAEKQLDSGANLGGTQALEP